MTFDVPPELIGVLVSTVKRAVLEELEKRESAQAERWLSDASVAAYADVSARTARRWRRDGIAGRKLPYVTVRGAARVRLSDLEAFLGSSS